MKCWKRFCDEDRILENVNFSLTVVVSLDVEQDVVPVEKQN